MTKRKIVLLSLIVIFAVIYIVQLTQIGKSDVQDIRLEEDITAIRLTHADGTKLVFTKQVIPSTDGAEDSDMWMLDDGTQVETFPLTRMSGQLKDIRILARVSSSAQAERYNLQEGSAIIVEALNGQEVVRTIAIGKASTTTSQTYAIIDNSNDIVLVSSDLNDVFGKTRDELIPVVEEAEATEITE